MGPGGALDCVAIASNRTVNASMPNLSNVLMQALLEMPAYLEAVYPPLPNQLLRARSHEDQMPLLEQLWHVRDCESDLYGPRIRRTLVEDRPFLEPMAVGHWPEERGYLARAAGPAVAEFGSMRRALVEQLTACTPQQLARTALRVDDRVCSVVDLIAELLDHDRDHRIRIAAMLAGFHGTTAPSANQRPLHDRP